MLVFFYWGDVSRYFFAYQKRWNYMYMTFDDNRYAKLTFFIKFRKLIKSKPIIHAVILSTMNV